MHTPPELTHNLFLIWSQQRNLLPQTLRPPPDRRLDPALPGLRRHRRLQRRDLRRPRHVLAPDRLAEAGHGPVGAHRDAHPIRTSTAGAAVRDSRTRRALRRLCSPAAVPPVLRLSVPACVPCGLLDDERAQGLWAGEEPEDQGVAGAGDPVDVDGQNAGSAGSGAG